VGASDQVLINDTCMHTFQLKGTIKSSGGCVAAVQPRERLALADAREILPVIHKVRLLECSSSQGAIRDIAQTMLHGLGR
jgi:hypothetical protein